MGLGSIVSGAIKAVGGAKGVLDIAGGLGSTALSMFQSHQNNQQAQYNATHSVRQRVEDLRKAGLNPILAATSGSLQGASVPFLQTADTSALANVPNTMTNSANAATAKTNSETNRMATDNAIRIGAEQVKNIASSTAKNVADAQLSQAQARTAQGTLDLLNEQALTQASQRALYGANAGLYSAQRARVEYQTVEDRIKAEYFNTPGGRDNVLTNYNASRGNVPFLLNEGSRSLDNLGRVISDAAGSASSSAKSLREKMPRNPHQKPVRFTYPNR